MVCTSSTRLLVPKCDTASLDRDQTTGETRPTNTSQKPAGDVTTGPPLGLRGREANSQAVVPGDPLESPRSGSLDRRQSGPGPAPSDRAVPTDSIEPSRQRREAGQSHARRPAKRVAAQSPHRGTRARRESARAVFTLACGVSAVVLRVLLDVEPAKNPLRSKERHKLPDLSNLAPVRIYILINHYPIDQHGNGSVIHEVTRSER